MSSSVKDLNSESGGHKRILKGTRQFEQNVDDVVDDVIPLPPHHTYQQSNDTTLQQRSGVVGWVIVMIVSLGWLFQTKEPTLMFISCCLFAGALVGLFAVIGGKELNKDAIWCFDVMSIILSIMAILMVKVHQL